MKDQRSSQGLIAGGIAVSIFTGLVIFAALEHRDGQGARTGEGTPAAASPTSAGNGPSSHKAPVQSKRERADSLPLAHTTSDVAIDGAIHVDADGNLIYNRDLRRFLDFFIGMTRSPDHEPAMRARMETVMKRKGVPARIQTDVLRALDSYLAYRSAVESLSQLPGAADADSLELFRRLKTLRRNHLGREMAEGFFGADEVLIENRLKRRRIMNNERLSKLDKQQIIQELESELPAHVREVRQQSRTLNNLHSRVRELRQDGASEERIRELRTSEVGAKAADRLARLDRERRKWREKLAVYQERKSAIEANKGLTRQDREAAIEALREQYFDSEHARRRARALSQLSREKRSELMPQQD